MKWWRIWKRAPSTSHEEAAKHLERLEQQQPRVDQLVGELRAARERNHFSEMVTAAFRGGRDVAPDR